MKDNERQGNQGFPLTLLSYNKKRGLGKRSSYISESETFIMKKK
jgi:hypothetical protein